MRAIIVLCVSLLSLAAFAAPQDIEILMGGKTYRGSVTEVVPTALPTASPTPTPTVPPAGKVSWHPGNWLYTKDVAGTTGEVDAALNSPHIKGILVRMMWYRDGVEPTRGVYNFNAYDKLAAKFAAKGKAIAFLFMPMDYWGQDCTPVYLRTAEFGGGQARGGSRCEPKLWNKAVADRLLAMYKAVADHFAGNPWFEGLVSGEISYTGAGAADWSQTALNTQIARIAGEAPKYFTTATFFFENNWGHNTNAIMAAAAAAGGGFSGPDLTVLGRLGTNPGGLSLSPSWGYPCYNRAAFVPPVQASATCLTDYYKRVALTMSGQEGLERSIKAGYTIKEIYDFAFNDAKGLRLTHLFWGNPYQTPGRSFNAWILPYIASVKGAISNTECPANIVARGGCR